MTTPCEVILFAADKSKADAVATLILQEVKRLEKKYNYFDPSSYLSELNSRKTQDLDLETMDVLRRSLLYYKQTNKIFDITIGTLKDIYKNAQTLDEVEEQKSFLMPFTGCEHIKINKKKLYFDNKYTKIDLGGFIKEYAVDRAVKIIRKAKIPSAIVNFGGDVYALGKKPNGDKFTIGIKDPHNTNEFKLFVTIENQALTTSASYERNYTIQNSSFSHIITKGSLDETVNSVSVISTNCVESGIFSTAIMIDSSLKTKNKVIIL